MEKTVDKFTKTEYSVLYKLNNRFESKGVFIRKDRRKAPFFFIGIRDMDRTEWKIVEIGRNLKRKSEKSRKISILDGVDRSTYNTFVKCPRHK